MNAHDNDKPLMSTDQFQAYLAASKLPELPEKIESPHSYFAFDELGGKVSVSYSPQGIVEIIRQVEVGLEEEVTQEILVNVLRSRGWLVEKPSSDGMISRGAVDRFKVAWGRADAELDHGNRVRRGLEAARPVMFFGALGLIDKTLDNVAEIDPDTAWRTREVVEMLRDLRATLTGGDRS